MQIDGTLIIAFSVIIIGAVFSIFLVTHKRKAMMTIQIEALQHPLPSEGAEIPLMASYSGLKGLAPITFSHNNLNPKLILYSDRIEYKVIFRKSAYYSDIETVRVFRSRFYNNVQIAFANSPLYFMAVFGNEETLKTVLAFLQERGITPDEKSRL